MNKEQPMKRTEPSAYLAPTKGQQKLSYVHSSSMEPGYLKAKFEAIRLAADAAARLSAGKSAAPSTRLAVIGRKS
jgi:hypothetical protein